MDNKNVFVAIALSMSVLLFWGAFFETPKNNINKNEISKQQDKIQKNNTPSVNFDLKKKEISREESIKNNKRINLENESIEGSILLKGALIDDISFKNYKKEIGKSEKVIFLNPSDTKKAYFIETGWAGIQNKIKVPDLNSVWKIKEGTKLENDKQIILEWNNGAGIIFKKTISIDQNFKFNISQEVLNKSKNEIELFPYGQISRNEKPDDYQGFFIMHEGFISVLDDELNEESYDDIEEKKIEKNASDGWIGITDKYWMTALIPPKDESFKSTFLYKENYKANFILNNGIKIKPGETKKSDMKIFVAAKEVNTIDKYALEEKISKFDLVIDWGWFYFFTKPLFFIVDYLFKYSGNFGIAIVLVTLAIRIIFFPLANYSFRSMAKMKALQPEMVRLKELHKEDKVKLQQDMMALYRKEKVNPASGCLPILIQIPFFFAIYKMLFISLEMRHQPFFGWIKDLSAQDPTSIFNLFGVIPWDPPGFLIIGIWPILMGLSMYLQQKLNPAPTDPIQAKIFAFFPLFLTIILASFPAGLVVYWTVNNILTIAQQWVIMRKTKIKTN